MSNPETLLANSSLREQFSAGLAPEAFQGATLYDGVPEGLVQNDTSYILHRTNYQYGEPPFEAAIFIKSAPNAAAVLGFHLVEDTESYFFGAPRADALNAIREALPADIGINTGQFVEVEEGLISAEQVVAHIARREIPIARIDNPYYTEHDITKHMLGYATMSKGLFSAFVELAKRAESSKDRATIIQASDLFDFESSQVSSGLKVNTTRLHQLLGASPMRAAIRSRRDYRHQEKIIKDLQRSAISRA